MPSYQGYIAKVVVPPGEAWKAEAADSSHGATVYGLNLVEAGVMTWPAGADLPGIVMPYQFKTNKNKEQAGMLPFGGSFLLTLDSLFSVVLLSYHPTSWVFFFPLSIGKFLTKNPLRSTQRFFLPELSIPFHFPLFLLLGA